MIKKYLFINKTYYKTNYLSLSTFHAALIKNYTVVGIVSSQAFDVFSFYTLEIPLTHFFTNKL